MQLLKEESVYEKAISRDLPKLTFLKDEHQRDTLFNIMKAYSLYDKDVGYNQNLLYITAPLLLNVYNISTFLFYLIATNRRRYTYNYMETTFLIQFAVLF